MTHNRPAGSRRHRSPHFRDAMAFGTVLCVILVSLLATTALIVIDAHAGDETDQTAMTAGQDPPLSLVLGIPGATEP
jgi:hypothetical protein